jgi:hypothetical protein
VPTREIFVAVPSLIEKSEKDLKSENRKIIPSAEPIAGPGLRAIRFPDKEYCAKIIPVVV